MKENVKRGKKIEAEQIKIIRRQQKVNKLLIHKIRLYNHGPEHQQRMDLHRKGFRNPLLAPSGKQKASLSILQD